MGEKRRNLKIISTAGIIVGAALWIGLTAALRNVVLFGYYIGEMAAFMLGGLPAAFLQLRLCLADKEKWVRWVPAAISALLGLAALILHVFAIRSDSMYDLLALLLVVAGLAPAAGICIGWLAYGKRAALVPLNILLVAYFVMNGAPFITRPFELADIAAAAYLLAGLFFAITAKGRSSAAA